MIYDISVPLTNATPTYPGDPSIAITSVHSIAEGKSANVSNVSMGSHTGTHIDPPRHLLDDGVGVDSVPLETLIGPCVVCDMGAAGMVTVEDLLAAGISDGVERVLLKTRNSELWADPSFRTDFTYLTPEAAEWLVERGVKLVGIDYLSVEAFDSSTPATHLTLLRAGVVIVEGLDLRGVPAGGYKLVCLPIKIGNGDGAPVRAALIAE